MAPKREDVARLIDDRIDAWCKKSLEGVADSYTEDATFVINRGEPMNGRADIAAMVTGFCDEFPDVVLTLDDSFIAGDHAVYVWTFTGHQVETGKYAKFQGWEKWELTDDCKVSSSRGWFDVEEYERQLS